MLGEFFTWWGGQLLDLAPARLRGQAEGADALVVDAGSLGMLTLFDRRRGTEGRLAQVRLDETAATGLRAALSSRKRGEAVLLRLPGDAVLERDVTLPLVAERDLDRVLGYDMERLTPFTAEEVFWGATVEERDKPRARLKLRLAIVPRATVQGLIDLLAGAGARPTLIETATERGTRAIRLNHDTAGAGRMRLRTRAALAVAAALLVAVVASPFLRQSLQLADAQDRLDGLSPRIAQVEALRRKIRGAGAGGDVVATETRRLGDTLEALAAITEILPDDSYLTEFTMRERKMTLAGLSASAPKLISLLSADPRVRNPAFTAPVTRAETGHNDVFAIRAELAP